MLILASSSVFRQQLLQKLNLDFTISIPDIDETRLEGESPKDLVYRLSQQKAQKVAQSKQGIIIASDQVALNDGEVLGKPLTVENAIKQLQNCSGKRVDFLTGLTVLNTKTQAINTIVEVFSVYFKKLSLAQIHNYISQEDTLNCAGSFKSEGLGIALFEKLSGEDPNSLIGLPLIKLINMLEKQGIKVL